MIFFLKHELIKLISFRFMLVFILILLSCYGCSRQDYIILTGGTMGTTYHIKISSSSFTNFSALKKRINKRLDEINQSMSTYINNSEISRFNRLHRTNQKFYVSDDFINVMQVAEKIYRITGGAWDGTIKPLVHLWGFDNFKILKSVPDQKIITKIVSEIGFNKIKISAKKYLLKTAPQINLDLASIAKGYAVDQISELLQNQGIFDFIVEIGGEVYAAGLKKGGQKWQIGINTPDKNSDFEKVYKKISLQDKALATSGNYRQFFEINGNSYTHVLDPRTGYPVNNEVVSVSILSNKCVFADGLATAIMVLGHKKGLELINSLDGVECLVITRQDDGSFLEYATSGFIAS